MYRVYHTEGLVLRGAPSGEANKTLALFTRDLGLVHAHAQGIRFEKSKLRYVLQPYSVARINLVRGRVGWRVVSALCEDAVEILGAGSAQRQALRAIAAISEFLERMLHGEEKNRELYDDVLHGIVFLKTHALSVREIGTVRLIVMMRILYHLGYWARDPALALAIDAECITSDVVSTIDRVRPHAVAAISKSLVASHL